MKWIISVLIISFYSCTQKFEKYQQQESGLWMQLITVEDSSARIENGGFVQFKYEIRNSTNSLLSKARILLKVNDATQKGGLVEALQLLNVKEKGKFIFPYGRLKQELNGTLNVKELNDTALLFSEIQIDHVFDSIQFHEAQYDFVNWLSAIDTANFDTEKEIVLLDAYEKESGVNFQYSTSGLRFKFLKRNQTGESASFGKRVEVSYVGRFINGTEFNSTKHLENGVQDFYIGQELQVIKGIEEVLLKMNEGDEVEVLLPSWLAFGADGAASGIVPPSTPVIYKIKLKSVN